LSFLGEGFELESAAADLWWQRFLDEDNRQPMTIRGGNDQLPKAIAKRLGQRIHFGTELRALRQTGSKVNMSVHQAGHQSEIEADRVVLAIPFSMLRQVDLSDSFSPGKRRAIADLRYTSQTHIYLQSRSRFWRAQGLSGSATTDLPMHVMGDATEMQAGSRGILMTENAHHGSQLATAVAPEERVAWALGQVSRVFPEIEENFEGGTSVAWDQEPWSMGGCAYYRPGELTTLFPFVARAEGRVHFAGEHTGRIFTMEGAAESGIRAAREVMRA
jgi:monoamine oxidase